MRQERIEKLEARLLDVLAANKRADEAEARRKCYECGSEMTACARCNPELPTAERDTLRAEVERRLEEPGVGWLYQNPDTGVEFSRQHPIKSGEVDDAEHVRPATAENLLPLLLEAWADLRERDAIKARADKAEGLQKMVDGVKEEATAEGRGLWKPCTGCHESEMGQTTLGGWSKMFGCEQGVGCLECGGLGVIWESEDYENMAEWMRQEDKKEAGRKAELTALRARVAELEGACDVARDALSRCYDVTEWPADGTSTQDDAIRQIDAALKEKTNEQG